MTQELREKILSAWGAPEHDDIMPKRADAAIALVLEEAARVAEDCAPISQDTFSMELAERCDMVAAAIRALKDQATT